MKMKKISSIIVIASLSIVSVSAQWYIGGSLDFNNTTIKSEQEDKVTSSSFSISPEVGYRLNSKLEVGISVLANFSTSKTLVSWWDVEGNFIEKTEEKSKVREYYIAPYFRYSIVKFNKLNLLGHINIYTGTGEMNDGRIMLSTKKYMSWGVNIYPVLIYDLSNKFALFSNLNFLNFGFSQTKIKDEDTTTGFSSTLDAYDILPSIGLLYKF
jgi:hypothetical protein